MKTFNDLSWIWLVGLAACGTVNHQTNGGAFDVLATSCRTMCAPFRVDRVALGPSGYPDDATCTCAAPPPEPNNIDLAAALEELRNRVAKLEQRP